MRSTPLALALAAILLAPAAGAFHCGSPSSEPDLAQATPLGVYYLDSEPCAAGDCFVSLWVYKETNARPGLQRDDFRRDDTCGDGAGDAFVALLFLADAL